MNVIFQSAACCACSFAVGGEMKAPEQALYQESWGGGEEHRADSNTRTLLLR